MKDNNFATQPHFHPISAALFSDCKSYERASGVGDSEKQKDANELLLRSLLTGQWDFSASELRQLEETAALCPFIYGQAVYRARALLNSIGLDRFFEDEDCRRNSSEPDTRNRIGDTETGFLVYPNPAKDKIIVEFSLMEENAEYQVALYDLQGRLISQVKTAEWRTAFSINHLDSGYFLLKVTSEGKTLGVQKVIVLR